MYNDCPPVRSRAGGFIRVACRSSVLGHVFAERATWWRNAINPANSYAHLRDSLGRFSADFDPFKSGANAQYVEGNAWQLSYFVPQDVDGLIGLMGRKAFVDRLEWGFVTSEPVRYNAPGDAYWDCPVVQGNQQSMHFAFLFNWPVRSSPRLPSTGPALRTWQRLRYRGSKCVGGQSVHQEGNPQRQAPYNILFSRQSVAQGR